MGALLFLACSAGTWWIVVDARGLGIGPWLFGWVLLGTTAFPIWLTARSHALPVPAGPGDSAAAESDHLVIDLRDRVVDLREQVPHA